jgi:uncharacterized protein
MTLMTNVFGAMTRRLDLMFPGYFEAAKHNHYSDFGWPTTLTFEQFYSMFCRNGIARAGVNKTVHKTWQTNPELWETEDPDETELEADIRQRFDDIRFWQRLAEADRRSLVGGYSGAILRVADSRRFQEPVDRVPGGLMGLVEIVPAWAGQLTVARWDTDEASPTYGQPLMFQFNEANVSEGATQKQGRAFQLHPDRVVIWSEDGTVHGRSLLEPGYNDLMSMEKVSGAGGEGFWKNAKGAPVLEVDKEARLKDMAEAMGVTPAEVADAMNAQVEDWQKGFDKLLMVQGITAKTLPVTLPQPQEFFNVALQGFASAIGIPIKILVGNQIGERASTEDSNEWAETNMARRSNVVVPAIREVIKRLERFGILPERDWHIEWQDLTESSMSEKIDRALKMAQVNAASAPTGELIYLPGEIRSVTGHEEIDSEEMQLADDEEPTNPPPQQDPEEEPEE